MVNVAVALPPHMLETWKALGLREDYAEKLANFVTKAENTPEKVRENRKGKDKNFQLKNFSCPKKNLLTCTVRF